MNPRGVVEIPRGVVEIPSGGESWSVAENPGVGR